MNRGWATRARPMLWQRLMLLVTGTVVMLWLALAATNFIFARFQSSFADLATAQVPRIALTGDLAGQSARLTAIATRVIGPEPASDTLMKELGDVSAGLEQSLSRLNIGTPEAMGPQVAALRRRIGTLIPLTESRNTQAEEITARLDALRWLNVDIQNEIDPLLSDYDFNIRSKMPALSQTETAQDRDRLLSQIAAERDMRDNVLQLGIDAGIVVTLLVQAASATDARQAEQLDALGFDMLSRVGERVALLPEADEFLTLRQSFALLRQYFDKDQGLFAQRRELLALEARIYAEILAIQQGLTGLNSDLATLAASERDEVLAAIAARVSTSRSAMVVLAMSTLGLGAMGLMLIGGVLRTRIVAPLREATRRLLEVSDTSRSRLAERSAQDEIGRIRSAVEDFADTVSSRDDAIADLKRTQAELVQAGKMAALGTLSAGISHELNQPLAALRYRLVLADGALRDGKAEELGRQFDRMADLTERMQTTISHLVRFARRADSRRAPVVLAQAVEGAVALVKNRIDDSGVHPWVDPSVLDHKVLGNEVLIEQVLVNLLTNALDAVADRKVGKIAIGAKVVDGMVELSVVDNGIGLGDLSAEDALNPFVTTKEAGRGMGLGLSISYNIAKDMGGDLRLSPASGGGLVASLVLEPAE